MAYQLVSPNHMEWMKLDMDEIPQRDLIAFLTYCDLPTKCKLRRVSRYFRYLVSLKEVNQVMLTDFRCLYVSGQAARSKSSRVRECDPGSFFQSRSLYCGWSYLYGTPHDDGARQFIRLSDHRRHGLMGDHVTTLIYNGEHDRFEQLTVRRSYHVIASIGMYCTKIQQIVLWKCGLTRRPLIFFRKEHFLGPRDCPDFPALQRVFVVASRVQIGCASMRDSKQFLLLTQRDSAWRDFDDKSYTDQLVECTPDQRAWAARFGPLLLDLDVFGMEASYILHAEWYQAYGRLALVSKPLDYQKSSDAYTRMLAFCIDAEGVASTASPYTEERGLVWREHRALYRTRIEWDWFDFLPIFDIFPASLVT